MEQDKLLRHKNGNGRKAVYSEVFSDTIIDKLSQVTGADSDILTSVIIELSTDDNCFVSKCCVVNSHLIGTSAIDSKFYNSTVSCDYVAGSDVYDSRIVGETKIKNSEIRNVYIKNGCIENAFLIGIGKWDDYFDLKHGYISGGQWDRPPKVLRFEERNVTLTQAENGQLHCNCTKFSARDWIRKAARYGRFYKLTTDELEQAIEFGKSIL